MPRGNTNVLRDASIDGEKGHRIAAVKEEADSRRE
jgi:hypothetical protein